MINAKNEKINKVISSVPFPAFLFSTILIGAILSTTGSAATHVFAATQPTTALPSCTDPTGQNLPCMMVISTLPPPPNVLQCQETSGQTLPCSYGTQNLSNGEQVVVITVYVPANYVFTGYGPWTVVKVVVHETKTSVVHVPECPKGQILNHTTNKCVDVKPPVCRNGQHPVTVNGVVKCLPQCERSDSDAITDLDKNLKTADCDINDPNEHGKTPPTPILSCNSPNFNGTCPTINNTKTGGSGAASTCTNNCTTGTTPPVDCTKNPTDPSCAQPLTPSTTTPTTKTCPDGSIIDASATCPNPNNPNTQTPPPPNGNNPPPSSSDNGNNNGGNPPQSSGGGSDNSNSGSSTTK